MAKVDSQLVDAWQRNNETNLFLLHHIPAKGLAHRYSQRTRTVAAQFAHIHNVRIYHLEGRGRAYLGKLKTFEKGAQPKKSELKTALKASEGAMAKLLHACETEKRVKSWNRSPTAFLGYLIAHEAHHRALVILSMRLSGDKLSKDVVYGIWNWGKKGSLQS